MSSKKKIVCINVFVQRVVKYLPNLLLTWNGKNKINYKKDLNNSSLPVQTVV